jgi:hypothetical protein
VDILDLATKFLVAADVAVESAAGLPVLRDTSVIDEFSEDWIGSAAPLSESGLGVGLLDGAEDLSDWPFIGRGFEDDVDVIGHDDPGAEVEGAASFGRAERIGKPVSNVGFVEEWKSVVAGEGEEAPAVDDLKATECLVVWFHSTSRRH